MKAQRFASCLILLSFVYTLSSIQAQSRIYVDMDAVGGLNGGDSWTEQASGIATAIFDVSFVDQNNGWTTAEDGMVLHTATAGAFWEQQYTGVPSVNYYEGITFCPMSGPEGCGAPQLARRMLGYVDTCTDI